MKRITVRELHLRTAEMLKQVAEGEVYVIERNGAAIAELRPLHDRRPAHRLPDREELLRSLPPVRTDSGQILEEDRS